MKVTRDFPCGPAVETSEGVGLIPSQGTKIQHATWYDQNWKEKKMKVAKGLPLDLFSPLLVPTLNRHLPFLGITLRREQKQT